MASTESEIKDGLTLPVWMKNRPTREFEPYAASPPAPEDFLIRYPKTEVFFGKPRTDELTIIEQTAQSVNLSGVKDKDWSRHTKPCQDVMHGIIPINTAVNAIKPKPAGVDDGFKGEGAACGNSVVQVAHQMISSGSRSASQRGFTVASPSDDDPPPYNMMGRRGSRSLPASPAHTPPSSPTARRKLGNRYFTSPFEPVDEAVNNRSWLTMALLGLKKDLTTSTSTLAEEDALEIRLQGGSLAESVENLGPSPKALAGKPLNNNTTAPTQQPKLTKPVHTFRPKPSEMREMNFWSPTSM